MGKTWQESEAVVQRGNQTEPEAPREKADPRRPGVLQCDPQYGACVGQRAHSTTDGQLRSTFMRFGSVTWGGWRPAHSSKAFTPDWQVCRYQTWWCYSKVSPLPDPLKHFCSHDRIFPSDARLPVRGARGKIPGSKMVLLG